MENANRVKTGQMKESYLQNLVWNRSTQKIEFASNDGGKPNVIKVIRQKPTETSGSKDEEEESKEQKTASLVTENLRASDNAVISFDGKKYELLGVPAICDGRPLRIQGDRFEPNLVFYGYEGDKSTSALHLPPPSKNREPQSAQKRKEPPRAHKPPLRLDVDTDSEEEEPISAVEFLKTLHKASDDTNKRFQKC